MAAKHSFKQVLLCQSFWFTCRWCNSCITGQFRSNQSLNCHFWCMHAQYVSECIASSAAWRRTLLLVTWMGAGSRCAGVTWVIHPITAINNGSRLEQTFIGLQRCSRSSKHTTAHSWFHLYGYTPYTIICSTSVCTNPARRPAAFMHPSIRAGRRVWRRINPHITALLHGYPAKRLCGLPVPPGWRRLPHLKPVFSRWNPCCRAELSRAEQSRAHRHSLFVSTQEGILRISWDDVAADARCNPLYGRSELCSPPCV